MKEFKTGNIFFPGDVQLSEQQSSADFHAENGDAWYFENLGTIGNCNIDLRIRYARRSAAVLFECPRLDLDTPISLHDRKTTFPLNMSFPLGPAKGAPSWFLANHDKFTSSAITGRAILSGFRSTQRPYQLLFPVDIAINYWWGGTGWFFGDLEISTKKMATGTRGNEPWGGSVETQNGEDKVCILGAIFTRDYRNDA